MPAQRSSPPVMRRRRHWRWCRANDGDVSRGTTRPAHQPEGVHGPPTHGDPGGAADEGAGRRPWNTDSIVSQGAHRVCSGLLEGGSRRVCSSEAVQRPIVTRRPGPPHPCESAVTALRARGGRRQEAPSTMLLGPPPAPSDLRSSVAARAPVGPGPTPADDRVEPARARRAPVTGRAGVHSFGAGGLHHGGGARHPGEYDLSVRPESTNVPPRGTWCWIVVILPTPAWAVQRALLSMARSPAFGPVASRRDRAHIVCRGESIGATIWRGMGAGRAVCHGGRTEWVGGSSVCVAIRWGGWGALGRGRVGGDGAAITVMRADAVPVS